MKKNSYLNLFLILFVSITFSCEEEDIERNGVADISTLVVSDITSDGVTFQAEVRSRGNRTINSYGFLWTNEDDLNFESGNQEIFPGAPDSDVFTKRITNSLVQGESYYVRAFIKTNDLTIFGEQRTFVSLGSSAPQISSFSPHLGTWGDTLEIRGNNFSRNAEENKAFLEKVLLEPVSVTDTLLRFVIPAVSNLPTAELKVEVNGNEGKASQKFSYIQPEITGIDTYKVAYGDTIRISVNGIVNSQTKVYFGQFVSRVIDYGDDHLRAEVSSALTPGEFELSIESNGFQDTIEGLSLLPVEFNESDVLMGAYGDTLTLRGTHLNPDISRISLKLNRVYPHILNATQNSIDFIVPASLDQEECDIQYLVKARGYNGGSFNLIKPELSEITSQVVESTDHEIIVQGKYFNTNKSYVSVKISLDGGDPQTLQYSFLEFLSRNELRIYYKNVFPEELILNASSLNIYLTTHNFNSNRISVPFE